jgi:hypothetical protein
MIYKSPPEPPLRPISFKTLSEKAFRNARSCSAVAGYIWSGSMKAPGIVQLGEEIPCENNSPRDTTERRKFKNCKILASRTIEDAMNGKGVNHDPENFRVVLIYF